jgi:hypothetical protein
MPPVIFDVWLIGCSLLRMLPQLRLWWLAAATQCGPIRCRSTVFGSTDFPLYKGIKADSDLGATAVGGGGLLSFFSAGPAYAIWGHWGLLRL